MDLRTSKAAITSGVASLFGSGKLKELERANEKLQDEVSKRNTNIEKLQSQVQQMQKQHDTLIIGGTSLIVYPAAGFIDYFRGKHLVVINKGATAREVGAELTIAAPIGEILGQIKVQ